jgi:cytochrome c biogenesis protein CcmG/thiol:disulfide interchange protein DsbE
MTPSGSPLASPPRADRSGRLISGLIIGLVVILIGLNIWYVLSDHTATGAPAPGFTLPRFNPPAGQPPTVSLRDLQGKVVVLDFWATWCPSCVRGLPEVEALYQSVDPSDVAVFAVNGEGKRDAQRLVKQFIEARDYQLPILMDNGSVFDAFDVRGIPQTVIIDRTGRIRSIHHGFVSYAALSEEVNRLLAESAQ